MKVNINKITASTNALNLISAQLARKLNVLPLTYNGEVLTIAAERNNPDIVDELESLLGVYVDVAEVENAQALQKSIARYYPESAMNETNNSAMTLFEQLLSRAMQLRVSDIHLEPIEKGGQVRFRVDGRLRVEKELNEDTSQELVSAVKVMAGLDIAEKRVPMDGNISISIGDDKLSLRIATMPTIHGERITLRLLSGGNHLELDSVHNLGMEPEHLTSFIKSLEVPNGIILLSGPTGSGKTTTLYAALRYLKGGEKHLISIEDPVECHIEGVSQIKVDSDNNRLNFAKALRGVLRHDPDIIMVGEIRDAETADIAIKSALTGHLVLSTVHTNNAVGVITRMLDLNVSPYLLSSTLRLAIAQRLVRQPCEQCVSWQKSKIERLSKYNIEADVLPQEPVVDGCAFCGGTGYAGRTGIYEMVNVDSKVKSMIMAGASEDDISSYVFKEKNNLSLKMDALNKVRNGLTTLDELSSITLE